MIDSAITFRGLKSHLLWIFLTGFFLIYFFYAGLPLDFTSDFPENAVRIPLLDYGQLMRWTINPLTPAWFYYDSMAQLRPVIFLIHKAYFDSFVTSLYPAQFLVSIGSGLFSIVLFLFVNLMTDRKFLAWLSVVLYLSFPVNTALHAGYMITEFHFFISLLNLGAMASLLFLSWQPKRLSQKILGVLFWVGFTWIVIKWRSAEKILPVIYLCFLLVSFTRVRKRNGLRWFLTLLGINLLMFALVVPIAHKKPAPPVVFRTAAVVQNGNDYNKFLAKEQKATSFRVSAMLERVWGDALIHPFYSPKQIPLSLTGNWGGLGVVFWMLFLLSPWLLWRVRKSDGAMRESVVGVKIHITLLIFVWFLLILLGYSSGASTQDPRFLNYSLVPSVFLFACLFWLFETGVPKGKGKTTVLAVLLLLLVISIGWNAGILLRRIGGVVGGQYAFVKADEVIYQDFFGKKPAGTELYLRHNELETRLTLVTWYESAEKPNVLNDAIGKLRKEKVLYVKANDEHDSILNQFKNSNFNIERIAEISYFDGPTLFSRVCRWLEKSGLNILPNKKVFVYRILLPSTTNANQTE